MIEFTLNGIKVKTQAPDDAPLLWVVRDEFKLKGSKFGCGAGLCGACSMLIDGKAERTCILPVAAVAGKVITTIEGLGSPAAPHPVQQAWIDHSVAQCGYCQSGQIISATALLQDNPLPDDAAIDQAMQGNLCRCGTYPAIKKAIKSVAQTPPLAYDATVGEQS
jgi:isoquinoline 1-oxidoreductase alpha subunit